MGGGGGGCGWVIFSCWSQVMATLSSFRRNKSFTSSTSCGRCSYRSTQNVEYTHPNVGHVADVQELRRTRPGAVPERYVRDRKERPIPIADKLSEDPCMQLSTIDLLELMHQFKGELVELTATCRDRGFFYVRNYINSHLPYYHHVYLSIIIS